MIKIKIKKKKEKDEEEVTMNTLIDVLPVRKPWVVILPVAAVFMLVLLVLEKMGL